MKKLLVLLLFCFVSQLFADEVPVFRRMTGGVSLPPRIFTVSPSQIRLGLVSEIVIQGENFTPKNQWNIQGIRILKERFVDSRTVILTVFPEGKTGLHSLGLRSSTPLSIEVIPSDILLSDDFEDGDISDWNAQKGSWSVTSGQVQTSSSKVAQLFPIIPNTDNVTIDFDLTMNSGKFAGIYFQYRDKKNFRVILLDGIRGVIRLKDRFQGFYETKAKFPISGSIYNTARHFTITTTNNRVALSVDSVPLFDMDLGYVYTGQIALYVKAGSAQFDNVVVSKDPLANAIPLASFTQSILESSVSFNANASVDPDGSLVAYDWNFGDASNGSGVTTDHDYTAGGSYLVTLAITDNSGARTKITQIIVVQSAVSDEEAIKQVVRRFFELLADIETLSPQQICADFSQSPSCPAYDKQVDELAAGKEVIEWFDVEFLSDVSVNFQSSTEAYPVRIRNKLFAIYFGDPALYYTDGWHIYNVRKEGDGKWHQCSYTFDTISTNED